MTPDWVVPVVGVVASFLGLMTLMFKYWSGQNEKFVEDQRKLVAVLRSDVDKLTAENVDLRARIDRMKDALDNEQDAREKVGAKLTEALRLQREAIEARATEALARAQAENARDAALATNVRLHEDVSRFQQQLVELNAKIDQLERDHEVEIAALTKRIETAEQARDDALALVTKRNGELAERDKLISSLRSDLTNAQTELESVQQRVTVLEKKDTGKLSTPPDETSIDATKKQE